MRVLQLCHKRPFPPVDGGSIAMHQVTQGLLDLGHRVKVLALDSRINQDAHQPISKDYLESTAFEAQYIDIDVKLIPAFLNLFSSDSYNVIRFYNKKLEQRLTQILQEQQFDIIQLEGLYMTPYIGVIRKHSNAPVIYRAHNIEHFIWERMAAASGHPLKKWYLRLLASRLKKYEIKIVHQVDGLLAISPIDLHFFQSNGFSKPSIIIPVGIPLIKDSVDLIPTIGGSVYHIGSMDWRPNQEGIEWFLQTVWPLVLQQNPSLTFYLAGKNMPEKFFRYASPNVIVAGEVEDATTFFLPLELMVVPLLSGGGMRVKIIEGMAYGKTIVSTTVGAEGIGCEDGRHILLADTPQLMAQAIIQCMQDKKKAREIANNARDFVKEHYASDVILKNLVAFYKGFFSE